MNAAAALQFSGSATTLIRAARWIEWTLLFVALPIVLALRPDWTSPLPLLWAAAAVAFAYLLIDCSFDRAAFLRLAGTRRYLPAMLTRFALLAAAVGIMVYLFRPDLLFGFPRQRPGLWLTVMLVYPIISVYPQNVVYRAVFFQRYQPLFGDGRGMVAASAFAFGFMHILFLNWIAVALTLIGGWLFAETYRRSRSLLLASFEHALYGCWMMTVGLGQYFYHGFIA